MASKVFRAVVADQCDGYPRGGMKALKQHESSPSAPSPQSRNRSIDFLNGEHVPHYPRVFGLAISRLVLLNKKKRFNRKAMSVILNLKIIRLSNEVDLRSLFTQMLL